MIIRSFTADNRFLSNLYPSKIAVGSLIYPTVEHAYQAAKTLDKLKQAEICGARTPFDAKRLGNACALRPDWSDLRLKVMEIALAKKFAQGSILAEQLLATDDAELIDGNNWHDKFWGVVDGIGENHLGRLLMERRTALRGMK